MTEPKPENTPTWQPPLNDEARAARRLEQNNPDKTYQFIIEAARLADERHCEDILILDLRGLSDLTDYVLIATGTSDRQIRAVALEVTTLAKEAGLTSYGRDFDSPTTWVAIDLIEIMAHFFDPETRAHYDIEMLWGDAPKIMWQDKDPSR